MSAILRVYDPSECDASGVPLDWECCRACKSWGTVPDDTGRPGVYIAADDPPCATCDGHGSLKAAAFDASFQRAVQANAGKVAREGYPRCEDCGHPMSEGTWEDPALAAYVGYVETRRRGEAVLLRGGEPRGVGFNSVHYSPCDEGCTHRGLVRYATNRKLNGWEYTDLPSSIRADALVVVHEEVEASWRQVDVRCLGWAHDLRPEKLAVLCLRCWVARG